MGLEARGSNSDIDPTSTFNTCATLQGKTSADEIDSVEGNERCKRV